MKIEDCNNYNYGNCIGYECPYDYEFCCIHCSELEDCQEPERCPTVIKIVEEDDTND